MLARIKWDIPLALSSDNGALIINPTFALFLCLVVQLPTQRREAELNSVMIYSVFMLHISFRQYCRIMVTSRYFLLHLFNNAGQWRLAHRGARGAAPPLPILKIKIKKKIIIFFFFF